MEWSNLHGTIVPAKILVLNIMHCATQKQFSFAFSYRSSTYYRGGSGAAELVRGEVSE